MAATESPVTAPAPGWARRLPLDERVFLWLVLASVAFMSAVTIAWLYLGRQNVPTASQHTSPQAFAAKVDAPVRRHQGADGRVYLPPGTTGYLMALRYAWYPELVLEAGRPYRIWISSADVLHGFSLVGHGENINLEIAPDHAFGATFTPDRPGRYLIVCNEFCGLGHADMKGHLDVVSAREMAAGAAAAPAAARTAPAAAPAAGAAAAGTVLHLSADPTGRLEFDTTHLTARAGWVTIVLRNPSVLPHDVAIRGAGVLVKGPVVSKGGVSTVSAVLKPGRYEFFCAVPGHEDAGMRGTLVVHA